MDPQTQQVLTLISAASNPANPAFREATQQLEAAQNSDYVGYVSTVGAIFANKSIGIPQMIAGGYVLLSSLTSKTDQVRESRINRWLSLPAELRSNVKHACVASLEVPQLSRVAAQIMASVASAELPKQQWPELIKGLTDMISNSEKPEEIRASALGALGYVVQDMFDPECLADFSGDILNGIMEGINHSSTVMKTNGLQALLDSLKFIDSNMAQKEQRNAIVSVVGAHATNDDDEIKKLALKILAKIVEEYYNYLPEFVEPIFHLTLGILSNPDEEEEVVMDSIEFWNQVAEVEMYITDCAEEQVECDFDTHHKVVEYAAGKLIPALWEVMLRQVEVFYHDDFSASMCASVAVQLIATTIRDKIVPIVFPAIRGSIESSNWREREAATMLFSQVVEGPSAESLSELVGAMLTYIHKFMSDKQEHIMVRDSASWALARLCSFQVTSLAGSMNEVIRLLLSCFQDVPQLARHVCHAFQFLAESLASEDRLTGPLSAPFTEIAHGLLQCVQRKDSDEFNLRSTAFITLGNLVKHAAKDVDQKMTELANEILNIISLTLQMPATTSAEVSKIDDMQSDCISVIYYIAQKIGVQLFQLSGAIMDMCFVVAAKTTSHVVYEEVFLVMLAVAESMGSDFVKFLPTFNQTYVNLVSLNIPHVTLPATMCMGSVCEGVTSSMTEHLAGLCTKICGLISDESLPRESRGHLLQNLGDLCVATGPAFAEMLPTTMEFMNTAMSQTVSNVNIDSAVGSINTLRSAFFYVAGKLFVGMERTPSFASMVEPLVHGMNTLSKTVLSDDVFHAGELGDEVIIAAVKAYSCAMTAVGPEHFSMFRVESVDILLQKALTLECEDETTSLARFVREELMVR